MKLSDEEERLAKYFSKLTYFAKLAFLNLGFTLFGEIDSELDKANN